MSSFSRRRFTSLRVERLEDRCLPSAVIQVGPEEAIKSIAQAAAVAQNGDTVKIDAGTYTGADILAHWTQNNITIEGVGMVVLDAKDLVIPNRKGIFVIGGTNVTVENIVFQNAHDLFGLDRNWAGIREEGTNLTIKSCQFYHNDDGLLVDGNLNSSVTILYSQFGFNGYGDGFSHNMYIGQVKSFTLEYSLSHDAIEGHDVKSRAITNNIRYNWLGDTGAGSTSYELSLPNGGTAYIIGNVIRQDADSSNSTIIDWGSEGATNPTVAIYIVNNTIVNQRTSGGIYIRLTGGAGKPVRLINNIYAGTGVAASTIYSGPTAVSLTNLTAVNPGFVNAAGFDCHLVGGSKAINTATAVAPVLSPTGEYVGPASGMARPVVGRLDIGAYEYVPPVVSVDLSASFNRTGIVEDGTTFVGGLTNTGAAISSHFVPSDVKWGNTSFEMGEAGSNNVISAKGQTITLPADAAFTLRFLATAVNGNLPNQRFVVHYTDGTSQVFFRSFSNWVAPVGYAGEARVVNMTYRDRFNGTRSVGPAYIYGYSVALNPWKTVQSITLPNSPNLEIFAMDLV
jgi:hypothetical protein